MTTLCPGFDVCKATEWKREHADYGNQLKKLWKAWGEDVQSSGQVHPAIVNYELVVSVLMPPISKFVDCNLCPD